MGVRRMGEEFCAHIFGAGMRPSRPSPQNRVWLILRGFDAISNILGLQLWGISQSNSNLKTNNSRCPRTIRFCVFATTYGGITNSVGIPPIDFRADACESICSRLNAPKRFNNNHAKST
jgi:hypothetical protein